MDETLKSLRTVHLTLCVVTAVMVLIMITTNQADRYQKGLDELQSLKDLSWDQYADDPLGILDKELRPSTLKKLQMEYGSVFEGKRAGHVSPKVEMKLLPLLPLPGNRISDYRKFIMGPNEIGFYEPADPTEIVPIISTDFNSKAWEPGLLFSRSYLALRQFQAVHGISRHSDAELALGNRSPDASAPSESDGLLPRAALHHAR